MSTKTLEVEIRVQARPETVFSYFTNAEKYRRWKGQDAELDPRPGGLYRVHMGEGATIRGEYHVVEPPRRLIFTRGMGRQQRDSTRLDHRGGQFHPGRREHHWRLRHTGLPDEAYDSHAHGWPQMLGRLSIVAAGAIRMPTHPARADRRRHGRVDGQPVIRISPQGPARRTMYRVPGYSQPTGSLIRRSNRTGCAPRSLLR
jgi:uncharacterized protein YndB with AHSA1/START domain